MSVAATAGGLPTRLGKYEILTPLASGGMARIYIGRSTGIGSFERHVVLKMILPERAHDHIAVQMFLDEARLAASLNHQNVAQVFEVGEDAGIHFLAMEYVHGQDLRALLAKAGSTGTRVPLELALTVVAGAASGLHHAHERRNADGTPMGIVHRDVSPSNIMIGYDGAVKLLDFGIAKATSRSVETQSGIIKGKFAYMAPEQCRGRDVDRRSDVFSLGIILYEVTTQHRCFRADSDFDTMHRIVTGDVVRPTRLVQGYPQALEAIVMKALSVDASTRYQSAGELLEAVEGFAVAARVPLSTMSLGRFMRDMFGEVQEPWLVPGRISQPIPPKEQTISNTNASNDRQMRPPSSPSLHEQAPMHLPPDPPTELPSDHDRGARGYVPALPAFSPSPHLPQYPVGRAPLGTQPIPPPQSFPLHPGSGSGPAHGALPLGPPIARTRQGYANAPGMSQSDISYPRYESPYGDDVRLQPNNRLLYIGLGIVLVGIIVLLAVVIADGGPDDARSQKGSSSTMAGAVAGAGESTQPVAAGGEPRAESFSKVLTPEPVKPEAFHAEAMRAGAQDARPTANPDEKITIHVGSTPPGAEVLLDGAPLGMTPLDLRRKRVSGVGTLTVHRNRFLDVTTKIDLASDYSKDVTLAPLGDDSAARPSPARDPKPVAPRAGAPERSERITAPDRSDRSDRSDRTSADRSERAPAPERTDRGDRSTPDRGDRTDPRPRPDRGSAPKDSKQGACQPPGQFNPFEKNCGGEVCPPCDPPASLKKP